ncbi:MAG: DUF1615 family protein [Pseudobacteriovorax sp.]|nr:DUF1615 family protein [Pseudobacteriovorax sp.]
MSFRAYRQASIYGLLAVLIGACSLINRSEPPKSYVSFATVKSKIPTHVKQRSDWAQAVKEGIELTGKPLSLERICAVVAIIEQESGFKANPRVSQLPKIVSRGIKEKLKPLGPLADPAWEAIQSTTIPSTNTSFGERINQLKTERDLDLLFDELTDTFAASLPRSFAISTALSRLLGRGDLRQLNPIRTAGSMQVRVAFAKELLSREGMTDRAIRDYLYTIKGGVRVGTARLLGYRASYDNIIYRFADYNSGMYSSRNAAFQKLLTDITGLRLRRDGDLLTYRKDGSIDGRTTQSKKAALTFAKANHSWIWLAKYNLRQEKTYDFERSNLWRQVRKSWQTTFEKQPPYAIMPRVVIVSPKLNGNKSTAWFANNVVRRYKRCRNQ